jgi:hypothetical protein
MERLALGLGDQMVAVQHDPISLGEEAELAALLRACGHFGLARHLEYALQRRRVDARRPREGLDPPQETIASPADHPAPTLYQPVPVSPAATPPARRLLRPRREYIPAGAGISARGVTHAMVIAASGGSASADPPRSAPA